MREIAILILAAVTFNLIITIIKKTIGYEEIGSSLDKALIQTLYIMYGAFLWAIMRSELERLDW